MNYLDPLNHHVEVEIDKGVNTNSLRAEVFAQWPIYPKMFTNSIFLVKIKFVTSLCPINTCLFE